MATHSNIRAWRTHGQKILVAYSPWGCKESDIPELAEGVQGMWETEEI